MAEGSSSNSEQQQNSKSTGSTTDGSAKKKWTCNYCTYLNWEASAKCVLCYQPRNRPMLIEELYSSPYLDSSDATHSGYVPVPTFPDEPHLASALAAEEVRWPCPACTYMNCRRTKRCVQCHSDRPPAYVTPPNSSKGSSPKGGNGKSGGAGQLLRPTMAMDQQQDLKETQQLISRALNKWSCPTCTFDNWPTAGKCTICGHPRAVIREKSRSPPQNHPPQQRKRKALHPESLDLCCNSSSSTSFSSNIKKPRLSGEGEAQQRLARQESVGGGGGGAGADLEHLDQLSIGTAAAGAGTRPDYTSSLDIYTRRFLANDPVEKLFFAAASAIGHRELQMVNQVVDYLINEGNLQRALTAFEARLLNQSIARGLKCRQLGFERADSLFFLAKKSDCMELLKLIRRVRPDEERLPCGLNCATRTRLLAKVTAQCMAVRDGGHQFKCQFIAQPHNFGAFSMPMPGSDLSLAVQSALFRPAPSIPPQLCYVDCFDAMASQGGLVVGRPPNFLMRSRGGPHSLYDSVFQAMFGLCDRFDVLRAATKYTMHRSAHLFKMRWLEQQLRMVRDCGLSVSAGELDADWQDLLNSIGEEEECPEPIHIWALAHVCSRPILVCSTDEPVDVDQLLLSPFLAGTRRTTPPTSPAQSGENAAETGTGGGGEGDGLWRQQQQLEEKPMPRQPGQQQQQHSYEGIYLPVLWGPQLPISRSPLLLCYRNGLFHAVIVSDALYQRDGEVQRYVRIRRSLRRPGSGAAHGVSEGNYGLFRFLSRAELESNGGALLAQFILFGGQQYSNAQQLSIRREPHPCLPETLQFYRNWMQAMLQLASENNGACGTATSAQMEARMDALLMGAGKKRKGGGPASLPSHQQALMCQLLSPHASQQFAMAQQGQGTRQQQQQQFLTRTGGGRASPQEEEDREEEGQETEDNGIGIGHAMAQEEVDEQAGDGQEDAEEEREEEEED